MTYKLEPLFIELTAPKGTYEVALTINAESDCFFSVFEDGYGTVFENKEIEKDTSQDIVFKTISNNSIVIEIHCDGNISATAMATYIGE